MNQIDFGKEVWDKKKIIVSILGLIMVVGAGYEAKIHFFDKTSNNFQPPSQQEVAGAQTNGGIPSSPTPAPKFNLQRAVDQLKNEVTNLNVTEIASSSPQVQQILKQVKGLSDLPKNEAKQVCERICSGL